MILFAAPTACPPPGPARRHAPYKRADQSPRRPLRRPRARPKAEAMLHALAHVDCWIFDLDNSLYPASAVLFARSDIRMGEYIQRLRACDPEEARRFRTGYFHPPGPTLAGLMGGEKRMSDVGGKSGEVMEVV